MSRRFPRFSRTWLILPPILVGVVVVALAKRNSQGPTRTELAETPRRLRVVAVRRQRVAPEVIGYGLAQPARTWRAVSEVDGRVIETHPRLDPGEMIPGGAMLLKIDPTDYQLRIRRLESQAAALAAQIR